MSAVIVIGAGGHGREVCQILTEPGSDIHFIGFVDDDPGLQGKTVGPHPIRGNTAWLKQASLSDDPPEVVCGIGTPTTNARVTGLVDQMGLALAVARSGNCHVAESAVIGAGSILFPFSFLSDRSRIGRCVTLNVGASVSHDTIVGDHTVIAPGARLAGGVQVGTECFIGMGASIIQGIRVGRGTTIGAGAVVIDDVPDGVTVVGVPARIIERRTNRG